MPKIIDHDQRRADIVDVTWQLIVEGGIEAATMREIAARAGFANGALKHYFSGKDQIIKDAYERGLGMMERAILTAVTGKRGIAAIRAHCTAALPLDESRVLAGRIQLGFWDHAVSNPDLAELFGRHIEEWRSALAGYLEEGRASGEIRTTLANETVISNIVLLDSGANVLCILAPEVSTTEVQEELLELLLHQLTQP